MRPREARASEHGPTYCPLRGATIVTLIDVGLAFLVVIVLSAVGMALVSGQPEDREELHRQLRWRRWR